MRRKAKLIITSAVVAALTVAGLSVAAGGSGGGGGGGADSSTAAPGPPPGFTANSDVKRNLHRPRHLSRDFADADVRAVLEDIRAAVAKQAPEIAGPVIDKAEQDGKITAAQADKLRQAAQDLADGKRPGIRSLGRDADVHEVVHKAFAAAADKAPGIAEPIIDKAVADNKITEAQADRIRAMVKRGGPGIGPGPGRPGRGPHGPGIGVPPHLADEDVRAVLDDIHAAVAKQAPDIVKPVIDKAEQDGKITAAQADRLRDSLGKLIGGKPRGGPPRLLDMRDSDVREVLHDAFEALAAKHAAIAKPIIDKALADNKITEAQADQLRSLRRVKRLHGPGPGHPPPPGFERPAEPAPPVAPGNPA